MNECPSCHHDIPEDSLFCYHCGKALTEIKKENKKNIGSNLKKNPRINSWSKLGMMLFLIALIIFDFFLATLLSAFNLNVKIAFYLSMIVYLGAFICGVMSLYIDRKDRKSGYVETGNKNYAYISICLSTFIGLVNLTQVILK